MLLYGHNQVSSNSGISIESKSSRTSKSDYVDIYEISKSGPGKLVKKKPSTHKQQSLITPVIIQKPSEKIIVVDD
jgi:hypothetical protein